MPEFYLASTKTKDLSTLLLSEFMLLCSFILSHPLYSSYFIFFSPYLFKLFSFLSPLFLTTTLFLLTFVNHGLGGFDYSNITFLLHETDRYEEIDAFGCLEMLEAIKITFETSSIELLSKGDCFQAPIDNKEKPTEISPPGSNQVKAVVKIFEEFLQEKDGVEKISSKKIRDKEVKSLSVESNKGSVGVQKEDGGFMRMGSKAIKASDPKVIRYENATKAMVNDSQRLPGGADWSTENGDKYNYNYQTMRKQKEWKRTLACKLLEERHSQTHNVVDEGMDLLWETYETDSDNKQELKTGSIKNGYSDHDYDEYGDGDETNGQLCCLQALKFSSGKMNLGMGRPINLVKITKTIKGFGWLHHVTSRHAKKGRTTEL